MVGLILVPLLLTGCAGALPTTPQPGPAPAPTATSTVTDDPVSESPSDVPVQELPSDASLLDRPSDSASPEPASSPSDPPGSEPVQQAQCEPLTWDAALDYLVKLTSVPPEERVAMTVGEARKIFAQEASFIAEGWPSFDLTGWRKEAWLDLTVTPGEEATLVTLRHGELFGERTTRFEMRCAEGKWAASQIGSSFHWFTALPSQLPGQDGELTEELALAILHDLKSRYGEHHMYFTTAGNERERARRLVVYARAGETIRRPWRLPGFDLLKLRPESPDRVIAEGYNEDGTPSGERLLFVREGGLWRIADHTEGGEWAPLTEPHREGPPPLTYETALMGMTPGASVNDVDRLLPWDENGFSPLVTERRLTWDFDRGLLWVKARTGSTYRGLQVGDPLQLAMALYGEPTERLDDMWVYSNQAVRLEVLVAKDEAGVERAAGFVLRRLWQPF